MGSTQRPSPSMPLQHPRVSQCPVATPSSAIASNHDSARDTRAPSAQEWRPSDDGRATAEWLSGWKVVPGTGVEPVRPVRAGGFYVPL